MPYPGEVPAGPVLHDDDVAVLAAGQYGVAFGVAHGPGEKEAGALLAPHPGTTAGAQTGHERRAGALAVACVAGGIDRAGRRPGEVDDEVAISRAEQPRRG